MAKTIGILTAGGDSRGLNAAIRAIGRTAARAHDMQVFGFLDGFRGVLPGSAPKQPRPSPTRTSGS